MQNFIHHIPTELHFGPGCLQDLNTVTLPGSKALIVISAGGSMRRQGYLGRVTELLSERGVGAAVFDKVQSNPTHANVMDGAAFARENGCDFVIGLGGGSSIDAGKAIAVTVGNGGDYWDYVNAGSGLGKPVRGALPVIAIPTTAGTGTEADPWSVITYEERLEKIGCGWPETFPVVSLVDPELMLSVPPQFTAFQGFDAFFHAAEGFISKYATPISDLYGARAMGLLYRYLPVAVRDGSNLEARTQVALASTLAGMVESTSSCVSQHALEHAMSAFSPKLPHGAGLIILSNAYFEWFSRRLPERFAELALAVTGKRNAEFAEALTIMQVACGVDKLKMSDYGITREDLPRLVKIARTTLGGAFEADPAELSDRDILTIFQHSFR